MSGCLCCADSIEGSIVPHGIWFILPSGTWKIACLVGATHFTWTGKQSGQR